MEKKQRREGAVFMGVRYQVMEIWVILVHILLIYFEKNQINSFFRIILFLHSFLKYNTLSGTIYEVTKLDGVIMESLYAVVINGTMLYVQGDLTEQEYKSIETIAKQFQYTNGNPLDCEAICQAFIEAVSTSLKVTLVQVPLQYVFRLRSHTK